MFFPVDLGPRASHPLLFEGPRGSPVCLGQLPSGGQTSRADTLRPAAPEGLAKFSVSLMAEAELGGGGHHPLMGQAPDLASG